DEVKFCPRDGQTLRGSNPTGDLVGQVIADRYHVLQKLGEGGMGAVYLAEHVKMGRRSAIKVMTQGMINDPEAISRFNREAANASRINHPNVCAVYDFGETEDGTIYLAMEYVEGPTLSALLKETGPLPLPRAAAILQQCAEALQAAHDLGIVHRDLKPDNIMVIPQRTRDIVKVVDFGIAKAAGGEGQKVTKTGLVVGTPEYMSPEQLSGDKLDGRSDLYSLALVFYRMITDTLPFVADTAQETMIKRLTDDPIKLAAARPDLRFPAALQAVMDRALARYPQDRFASATEFALAAMAAVEGQPVPAVAGTEAKTQVLVSGSGTSATRVPPATRVSSPSRRARLTPVTIGVGVVVLALAGGGFAMRDALFGGGGQDSTAQRDSLLAGNPDTGRMGADSSRVQPNSDTGRASPTGNGGSGTQGGNGGGTPSQGPGTQREDTATPPRPQPDVATLRRQIAVFADDFEFVDVPERRNEGLRLGTQIWRDESLPADLRAQGAFVVYQVRAKEATDQLSSGKRAEAKAALEAAVRLDPSQSSWKTILQGL
ncbi:MAG: serine/threonine-protein kinase, partial [Gemmatimonadales bacterium]